MTSKIFITLQNRAVALCAAVAATALAGAFTAQYVFGLEPCELCLFQRVPYAAVIGLGVLYAIERRERLVLSLMVACFAIETALAGFHVGVEQHWWEGFSACSARLDAHDFEVLRNQILNGPKARCDQIAWSMFGISMAGYNFLLALGLTAFSFTALLKKKPTH